ncbi:MAG: transposase, partial [Leptolyngbyaceae cyanobacterium]
QQIKALGKSYPTNLNDQQWQLLKPLIPPAKAGDPPRTVVVTTANVSERDGAWLAFAAIRSGFPRLLWT